MSDNRIVDYADYGIHILLKCRNHLDKRWSTKNILYIGARSLFYDIGGTYDHGKMGPECDCPMSDLIPLTAKEAKE